MKTFKLLIATLCLTASTFAFAGMSPSVLTLKVDNETGQTISLTGFQAQAPGLTANFPAEIANGSTATITCTSTQGNDFFGVITSTNAPNGFVILDPDQFHTKQPVFMVSDVFKTTITNKIANPDHSDPHHLLLYSEASVVISK